MGVIATDNNKVTLIYSAENSIGKQTLGYVSSATEDILTINSSKTKITGTQWAEIADKLKMNIRDLVDQNHPNFAKEYGDKEVKISNEDCIKVLQNKPETLAYAILINGNDFALIKTPSDVLKYLDTKTNNNNQ